jgi:hypothetical protein
VNSIVSLLASKKSIVMVSGCRLGWSEAETQLSRTSPGDGESTPGEPPKPSSFLAQSGIRFVNPVFRGRRRPSPAKGKGGCLRRATGDRCQETEILAARSRRKDGRANTVRPYENRPANPAPGASLESLSPFLCVLSASVVNGFSAVGWVAAKRKPSVRGLRRASASSSPGGIRESP